MERMSKAAEKRLITSVEQVIEKVAAGDAPTEALTKIATANNHSAPEIKRIAEAYNQSRTIFELSEKRGSERLNSFALANAETAIAAIYPKTVTSPIIEKRAAVAKGCYGAPSATNYIDRMTKAASEDAAKTFDLGLVKVAAVAEKPVEVKAPYTAHQLAALKLDFAEAQEKAAAIVRRFPDEFRVVLADVSFHDIEVGMITKYGSAVEPLVKLAWELSGAGKLGHRRATASDYDASTYTLMDFRDSSFASAENLVSAATNLHKKAQQWKAAQQRMQEVDSQKKASRECEKQADVNWLMPYTSGVVNKARSVFNSIPAKQEAGEQKALERKMLTLEDSKYQDKIKQIRIQSMLHDFMSNDEVISGYDPEEAIQAFNDINSVSPDIVDKPVIMRDLVRRYLINGGLESMEIGQAAQLGKTIVDTSKPRLERKSIFENALITPQAVGSERRDKAKQEAEAIKKDELQAATQKTQLGLEQGKLDLAKDKFDWEKTNKLPLSGTP